jgi:hypothetical protein
VAVDADVFPGDLRVPAETALPACVADDGIRAGVGMRVLGRREEPAQRRFDGERLEVVAGDQVAPRAMRARSSSSDIIAMR